MSGKRHECDRDRHHRSHSFEALTSRAKDSDFQLALKLSAELNGDLGGHEEAIAAASKRQADYEADFDSVLLKPFKEHYGGSKATGLVPPYFPHESSSSSTASNEGTTGNTTALIIETEISTGQGFQTLSEFANHVKDITCSECGDRYFKCESDVSELFNNWYEGNGELSSFLTCKTCKRSACATCPPASSPKRSMVIVGGKSISWCCSTGRLVLTWLLLCGFDSFYCETKIMAANKAKPAIVKPKTAPTDTFGKKGKAKGKGKREEVASPAQRSGVGYGGGRGYSCLSSYMSSTDLQGLESDFDDLDDEVQNTHWDTAKLKDSSFTRIVPSRMLSDSKSRPFVTQQPVDKLGLIVLSLLQHLLPSHARDHPFDMAPPLLITDMLMESRILEYCSELLRNNSLDDALARNPLYVALIDFVQTISLHFATAQRTVFTAISRHAELCNLLTRSWCGVQATSSEVTPAIADSLHDLSKLSDLLLKNADHHQTISGAEGGRELLSLCQKISILWKNLSMSVPASLLKGSKVDTPAASAEEVAAVSSVDDDRICETHAFATQAKAQFRSAPGRFKRLFTEIDVLRTSLPPGIFLRHGDSRLDVMKCIIVGPGDSPYENGLFEFDFYCPADYPSVPPLCSFKGTGGGKAGINPNLYADGKVCLSLLGTWPGEPWQPGESTLLQVLVSLQAMVFCEQPWYNEPGRELSFDIGNSISASETYNDKIRRLTVRLAMLSWLDKSPELWKDIVAQHFASNANKILGTVVEWSKRSASSTPLPRYPNVDGEFRGPALETGYGTVLPKLHKHLLKYGATIALPGLPKEDVEPQSKKPRVSGTHGENDQDPDSQPHSSQYISMLGLIADDLKFDRFEDMNKYTNSIASGRGFASGFAAPQATRGGYRGLSTYHSSYDSAGRGQMLGAGRGIYPPMSPGGSGSGRGRGNGLTSWRGRGAASAGQLGLRDSVPGSRYGDGGKFGDENDTTGHGEPGGGSGGSKA